MSTVDRIRNALRNGQVVLERGQLRISDETTAESAAARRSSTRATAPAVPPPFPSEPVDEFSDIEPPTSIRLKPTTWAWDDPWYLKPRFERRLAAEVLVMRQQFPLAELTVLETGQLTWILPVVSLRGCRYDAALVYPLDFPSGEISAYVTSPQIDDCPHQFHDGRLCLGHRFARQTSALTTAMWVSAWVSAYEVYGETGEWPEFANDE